MREIFDCKISVADYLSFFRTYMIGNLSIEKDLGIACIIKAAGIRSSFSGWKDLLNRT